MEIEMEWNEMNNDSFQQQNTAQKLRIYWENFKHGDDKWQWKAFNEILMYVSHSIFFIVNIYYVYLSLMQNFFLLYVYNYT